MTSRRVLVLLVLAVVGLAACAGRPPSDPVGVPVGDGDERILVDEPSPDPDGDEPTPDVAAPGVEGVAPLNHTVERRGEELCITVRLSADGGRTTLCQWAQLPEGHAIEYGMGGLGDGHRSVIFLAGTVDPRAAEVRVVLADGRELVVEPTTVDGAAVSVFVVEIPLEPELRGLIALDAQGNELGRSPSGGP